MQLTNTNNSNNNAISARFTVVTATSITTTNTLWGYLFIKHSVGMFIILIEILNNVRIKSNIALKNLDESFKIWGLFGSLFRKYT